MADERQAPTNIIVGQYVDPDKQHFAKQLRRTMTQAERLLWEVLRANRFHGLRFRRQQVTHGYIVDFYCHALRLVIEVDGSVHESTREWDAERDEVLRASGFTVVRVTNDDVLTRTSHVLERLDAIVREHQVAGRSW